jgi:hypothetical protein
MMFSEGTGSAHVNQPLSAAALPAISNASTAKAGPMPTVSGWTIGKNAQDRRKQAVKLDHLKPTF